jgi:hypothetical protein
MRRAALGGLAKGPGLSHFVSVWNAWKHYLQRAGIQNGPAPPTKERSVS